MGKSKKKQEMRPRDDEDRRRAAHHIAHEIRMLGRAFDRHRADPFAYTAWFVHARSLTEFFRDGDKEKQTDIVASDFLSNWSTVKAGTTEPKDYAELRCAANILAAHPSYLRLDYEKGGVHDGKGVPTEELTDYLLGLARLFVNTLPSDRQVWFAGAWR